MRRLLQLFVLAAVLACGMHPGEPAQAHEDPAEHVLHAESHMPTNAEDDRRDGSGTIAHAGHSHCPMAPDPGATGDHDAPAPAAVPLFARPVKPLESFSQPPLVEPPAA
jgi:diadenosine tetraphosphatase ApaH/serine/threonine PP2A family protein phosphatase